MRSTQNPYEQLLKFGAEAIILHSIFGGIILTANALRIAYDMIEEFKG